MTWWDGTLCGYAGSVCSCVDKMLCGYVGGGCSWQAYWNLARVNLGAMELPWASLGGKKLIK